MNAPLVTVTVPAFKRPELIDETIRSFRMQDFESAELIVSDNGADDATVAALVAAHAAEDPRIRISKNATNLGYAGNFIKMLQLAQGKYIVILGDDDVFASEHALRRYVDAFEAHPEVGFVYSNMLQFNGEGTVDYAFPFFDQDQVFAAGHDSFENTWLKSSFIPGMGLRNDIDFVALYPGRTLLFPQVEMVGKILCERASMGLGEYLVAGRAHQQQLGFEAMVGKRAKRQEQHAVDEFGDIAAQVTRYASEQLGKQVKSLDKLVHRQFRKAHATIFPTEKISSGNARIVQTFVSAFRNDPVATLADARFCGYFLLSLVVPRRPLFNLKESRKHRIVSSGFDKEQRQFDRFLQRTRAVSQIDVAKVVS